MSTAKKKNALTVVVILGVYFAAVGLAWYWVCKTNARDAAERRAFEAELRQLRAQNDAAEKRTRDQIEDCRKRGWVALRAADQRVVCVDLVEVKP